MGILKKIWLWLFPEKHHVTIVYPDRTLYYRIKYPKDGMFEDERGNAYYLDRNKTVHVFVGGYANEIDGVRLSRDAKRYEFEPSETFKVAMESNIRRAIYGMSGVESWMHYIVVGGLLLVGVLNLLVYMDVLRIIEALEKVGLIGG